MKYYLEKGWSTHNRHLPPGFGVAPVGQSKKAQPLPVQAQITPERNWRTEYRNLPPKFGIAAGAIPGGPRRRVAARTARGLGGYGGLWDDIVGTFDDALVKLDQERLAAQQRLMEQAKAEALKTVVVSGQQAILDLARRPDVQQAVGQQALHQASSSVANALVTGANQGFEFFRKNRTWFMAGAGIIGALLLVRAVRGIASPYSKK